MKGKAYPGIDAFRIVAAILVIAIHTYPLADLNSTADYLAAHVVCRIAVPFFFMASGFFLFPAGTDPLNALPRFLKRSVCIYAAAIALYIPVNLYTGYFKTEHLLPAMLRDVFFDGTFYHLWYLPAAILGACIAGFCLRRLGIKGAFAVCAVLYLIGLFGDSYYAIAERVPFVRNFYDALFSVFDYTRNGIFFAPLFFVLGGALRRKRFPLTRPRAAACLCLALLLLLGEGMILHNLGLQRHDSMYLLLAPCVFVLFWLLQTVRGNRLKRCAELSLLVYLIHPLAILFVRLTGSLLHREDLFIQNNLVHFFLTVAVSFSAGCLLLLIRSGICSPQKKPVPRVAAEIDTENLRHNVRELQSLLPEQCKIMAVVKADAYGHGAPAVAAVLREEGISDFAVATIEEGIALRSSGIEGQILIFGYTDPESIRRLRKYRLTQTLISKEYARRLNQKKVRVDVQIKIDTGMHRLGLDVERPEDIQTLFDLKYLHVTGMYTHLCVSESLSEEDSAFTLEQTEKMDRLTAVLSEQGCKIGAVHVQNSGGILNAPFLRYRFVRPGIALYGVKSSCRAESMVPADLRPVLTLKTQIILIRRIRRGACVGYGRAFTAPRDMTLAVLSAGYADGIPRCLSDRAFVLIRGKKAPIVGRICMDQMTVDITDIPEAAVEDDAILIGRDGNLQITAEKVAEAAGTITNELLSRIGERVERVYL